MIPEQGSRSNTKTPLCSPQKGSFEHWVCFFSILIQLECHTNTSLVPASALGMMWERRRSGPFPWQYPFPYEEKMTLATCTPPGIPFPRVVGLQHQSLWWESRTIFQFTLSRQFSLSSLQHYISAVGRETNLMTIYWSLMLKARGTHKDNSCETETIHNRIKKINFQADHTSLFLFAPLDLSQDTALCILLQHKCCLATPICPYLSTNQVNTSF